jgi:anthraniloyl-CoA monooxygenase
VEAAQAKLGSDKVTRALDIACVGGGAAGLYFAVLAKQANPRHRIRVFERNSPDVTFGFGVVFSENTMGFLSEQDQHTYPEIMAASRRWDPITVIHQGEVVRCGGVGFAAVERRRLLEILQSQARAAGVELFFEHEVHDLAELGELDLVVIAGGVHSPHRDARAFGTSITLGSTRFAWLGTTKSFDSLTFFFERSEHGVFGVHSYPYGEDRSTFIVETDEATWLRAGMNEFSEEDTVAYCERLFAEHLDGHRLLSNRSIWAPFRTVRNRRWHAGNRVLVGDAAHTAHFSVGSGTKMAMEDGLALAWHLERLDGEVEGALVAFEAERRPRVEHIQQMAETSFDWWQNFRHYVDWRPYKFTFHFLTRSQFRYDTLKDRDPEFLRRVEEEQPELDLEPLVLVGSAAVSEDARISLDQPLAGNFKPVPRGRSGLQLNHAGPRGACHPRLLGMDEPLPVAEAWPLVAASPIPYGPLMQLPKELDAERMRQVERDFAAAAATAAAAGFVWLELQFGQGYLLGSFLSAQTNRRSDLYGGDVARRLRFPLAVLTAVRAAWPTNRSLTVAVSADEDLPEVGRALLAAGADALTVLAGQQTYRSAPAFGRVLAMLPAGKLRNETGVPAWTAGGITDLDDVRTVLLSGRAEYVRRDRYRREPR